MLVSPSSSSPVASLLNDPGLLQDLVPGVNLSSLEETLQVTQTEDEAPLTNLANQQVTLTNQSRAWSEVQSVLSTIQGDVKNLSTTSAYHPTSAPVSANPAVVSASGTGAAQGTYEVQVKQLATPQVTNSGFVAGPASQALGDTGTLTLSYEGQTATVNVTTSDSLDAIANNINAAAAGLPGLQLTASVLPSQSGAAIGSVLSLSANTGNGAFSVSASGTSLSMSFSTVASSQAAEYTVNGVGNDSNVNTIQNALAPGVTLSLLSTTSAPVSLTVSSNPGAVTQLMSQLVSDVQSGITTLNGLTGQGGTLEGNAAVTQVSEQLVNYLSQVNPGLPADQQSLAALGLSVSWSQANGEQVSFSSAPFTQALNSDPAAVQDLMLGSASSPGIIGTLSQFLANYLAPSGGIISAAQSGITNQETLITNQQTSLQSLVQQEQHNAESQFIAALNSLVKETTIERSVNAQFNLAGASSSSATSSSGG